MPLKKFPNTDFHEKGFRVVRTPFFLLKIRQNQLLSHRIAVIVGKSAITLATKRNFLKRQAREILLKSKRDPSDIILIFNAKVALSTKKDFQEEIRKALI